MSQTKLNQNSYGTRHDWWNLSLKNPLWNAENCVWDKHLFDTCMIGWDAFSSHPCNMEPVTNQQIQLIFQICHFCGWPASLPQLHIDPCHTEFWLYTHCAPKSQCIFSLLSSHIALPLFALCLMVDCWDWSIWMEISRNWLWTRQIDPIRRL